MRTISLIFLVALAACDKAPVAVVKDAPPPAPTYFKVDPKTAGSITGTISFSGKKPMAKRPDMSSDPACVAAAKGKSVDASLTGNVFIYIKSGLEDKKFEVPGVAAKLDQSGCWFRPRVMGVQAGQEVLISNSDPVTHNVHPLAKINREWNHSQPDGEPPLSRKFAQPEIMIPVKCNIHSWMHAFIGVVAHPYFAVSADGGKFEIANVPPGDYTLEAWQEALGAQEMKITVAPASAAKADFKFTGE